MFSLSRLVVFAAAFGLQAVQAATVSNGPVIYEDLADLDVFRVNSTYYYTASTMHYSPGAPILESTDLVNWAYIGHAVPSLSFGNNKYSLEGGNAYVKGIYASSMRRRPSDGQWFWIGCIEYSRSYVYTAPSAAGPWTQLMEFSNKCYYDCGLLFDDDGKTPYVAYGSTTIHVAQLANDLKSQVKDTAVYTYPVDVEGSRMYKIKGTYYIINDAPSTFTQYVMKSSSIGGTWTSAVLSAAPACPVSGANAPHQGSIVDDVDGNWYYMAFCDSYPGGRVPVLAPIIFTSQGFPQLANTKSWPKTVTTPMAANVIAPLTVADTFSGTTLGPQYEWNHNPDTTKFNVNNGLTLDTATVTSDLNLARNTLTHRILGPKSEATIKLDYSKMQDGDRAGLVLLRDASSWVGLIKTGSTVTVNLWSGITLTSGTNGWTSTSAGSIATSTSAAATGVIYLRCTANILPSGNHQAQFSYSTTGSTFTNIGGPQTMVTAWEFFMGYRYGMFNFATKALGGSVVVESFNMQLAS
ncbi:hypothetical protein LTR62_008457 [Meristemomyces frigidus]|uniref:Beta-xylosidase C-terminal Concanavalin A-like domain-containing protein n=1 Tax=Meristemomyces frigidus TaxID=1508187 RepID=A0AAN7TU84_9PEZI|nr:hypothetical protein LTR62_008457 [Meristemomyces frigidus]